VRKVRIKGAAEGRGGGRQTYARVLGPLGHLWWHCGCLCWLMAGMDGVMGSGELKWSGLLFQCSKCSCLSSGPRNM
jgi:hypothetical protein